MQPPVKPLNTNAADEGQIKEAQAKAKRGRELEISDLCFLLASKQGRRFVWRYLSLTGIFRLSFNHSGSVTAFNEGQRQVGLEMLNDVMEANPESYLLMTKESKEDNANV